MFRVAFVSCNVCTFHDGLQFDALVASETSELSEAADAEYADGVDPLKRFIVAGLPRKAEALFADLKAGSCEVMYLGRTRILPAEQLLFITDGEDVGDNMVDLWGEFLQVMDWLRPPVFQSAAHVPCCPSFL